MPVAICASPVPAHRSLAARLGRERFAPSHSRSWRRAPVVGGSRARASDVKYRAPYSPPKTPPWPRAGQSRPSGLC